MDLPEAQRWANDFLDERAAPPTPLSLEGLSAIGPATGFSPFLLADAVRAREASRELMLACDLAGGGDPGLEAAWRRADELLAEHDRALVRFALKLFLTHHPDGRRLRITALERRAPSKVIPSRPAEPSGAPGAALSGFQESALNWWREDPEANEHHDHWHAVYPTGGIADPQPDDPLRSRLQDRQGELFFYMHQQMLARYDHERIALGLPRVEPLANYGAPIPEGYDPSTGLAGFPAEWTDGQQPSARPDGARMPNALNFPSGQVPRSSLDLSHTRLLDTVQSRKLRNAAGAQFDADIDHLGHATEPDRAEGETVDQSTVPDPRFYGAFHGLGHIFLAFAAGAPGGVMVDTDTAIRDPVFYRWHRHIDDLGFEWQQRQPPHDLSKHAAGVALRHAPSADPGRPAESPDLILLSETDFSADPGAFAAEVEAAVGDANWDDDFSSTAPGMAELQTELLQRPLRIEPPVSGAPPVNIPYLDQRPFAYAVRLENTAGDDHDVTLRLFIVADSLFDERRMWIELDKFRHRVSGQRSVAVGRASESAVIRKPAEKPPGPTRHSPSSDPDDPPAPFDEESYCDCGWPYNLLLPRGTAQGMDFWLAAIVTDWAEDRVTPSACGSMSFCGAKQRYPDRRSMGYPFDRPISGSQIAAALTDLPHAAARRFKIRWLNPQPPG
jgi:hypothetical protein